MYEKVEICPVCDNTKFDNYIICKDHLVTNESFAITKCSNCDFLVTNPRPDESEIVKYYKSADYVSHTSTKKGLVNKIYHIVRKRALKQKLRLINNQQPNKGKILDIGCGTGHFLDVCQKDQWDITGIEVDPDANQVAQERLSVTIHTSLNDLKSSKYNIITLWHVLEHVHSLNAYLQQIAELLDKNGTLIIAVPNHDSFDRQHYQHEWAAYDVPRHLYHFTQSTMKRLMKKHKLKVKAVKPMKYDSYYVSMLSEKHISGKTSLFKAFKLGRKSNNYAKQHKNNYSSLIYVIKH